jgi:lipase ATG15
MFAEVFGCGERRERIEYPQTTLYTTRGDVNIGPDPRPSTRTFFVGSRSVYNLVLGVIFVLFLFTMMIGNAYRYTIQCLAIYIPPLVTAFLVLLYALHGILSIFGRAREHFAEHGDFSDPFLCSMYFRPNPWANAFRQIRQTLANRRGQADETRSEIEDEPITPIWLSLLTGIFSKFTIGVYATLGVLAILVRKHQYFTAGQLLSVVFAILFVCFPIMVTVTFPLLFYGRWFTPALSDEQVQASDRWIRTEGQRVEWLNVWFLWSRRSLPIRLVRIFWLSVSALIILIALTAVSAFNSRSAHSDGAAQLYRSSASNQTVVLKNPICYISMGGFDMVQMAAFAESSYIMNDTDGELVRMFNAFFGEGWESHIFPIATNIDRPWWHSNVGHFLSNGTDHDVHIFSIRGTFDMIDVVADVELWAASLIMNVMKMTIPIFSGYADDSRYFIGYSMELPRYMFTNFSLITGYVNIVREVIANATFADGAEVILAGHSLGGGLAKIVSAITGFQAVAISGPGITAVEALYAWKSQHIPNSFVNVVPNLDPVAGIDRPTGSAFMIPCEAGVLACHSSWRSQCMLATICGKYDELYKWCSESLGEGEMEKIWKLGAPYIYSSN